MTSSVIDVRSPPRSLLMNAQWITTPTMNIAGIVMSSPRNGSMPALVNSEYER